MADSRKNSLQTATTRPGQQDTMERHLPDFYSAPEIIADPKVHFDALRSRSPAVLEPFRGRLTVTAYEAAREVLWRADDTCSPGADTWCFDGEQHSRFRALLAGSRRFRFEPTYSFRSLADLHVTFSPA